MSSELLLLAADSNIEADYAVLVAGSDRRNVAREVILALNDLLRALRDIGAVSQRDVIGKLLLNGDLGSSGRGIGFRGQALRIDLDAAGAKQLLDTAAYGGIDRLVDDQWSTQHR